MPAIARNGLLSLEAYARERQQFRAAVMEHKKVRKVHLGESITLIFEDELTVRYQIQEMLRAERIFEDERIQEELDAYNPLVPDGQNLKATMMIEYADPAERKVWLEKLVGVEDKVWIQVQGCARVFAVADEDLDRENEHKTSAVHFLRFELSSEMVGALKHGVSMSIGASHPHCDKSVDVAPAVLVSLLSDLA